MRIQDEGFLMNRPGRTKLTHTVLVIAGLLLAACPAHHTPSLAPAPTTFSNPVISGFAPDPSIVRVGDDFYLVNSTFEYFPGIPVYHSRDLVNWQLIGHALHEASQADLARISSSGGIHASTIRHHAGMFYVITTNVIEGQPVNFIVTASDPGGPWSAPYVLEGAPGIDPSLFFDDDGRAWYVGNRIPPDPAFPGQAEIWLQELDLTSMRLVGDRHYLWRGCCGGVWAEGPHIYKRNGYYYLLISEGGTAFEHALSVAISSQITGPYASNPRNPVLTHRQLSYDHPISGVGHADLVELPDGRWYAVVLGWRLVDGEHGILGRETFLVPVTWETEPYRWKDEKLTYPVFSPATGRVELHFPMPFPGTAQNSRPPFYDQFDNDELKPEWNFRRTPVNAFHSLRDRPGALRLRLQSGHFSEKAQYSFAGIRQRDFQFTAVTQMAFTPTGAGEEAGLAVIQNDRSAIVMSLSGSETGQTLHLYRLLHGEKTSIASRAFTGKSLHMKVTGDYLDFSFYASPDGERWSPVKEHVDITSLSPALIQGFNYTGIYLGLYATSNGTASSNHADFEYFTYQPTAEDRDEWYYR